jgi:hypothetical protein
MLDFLQKDPSIIQAARVSRVFKLDPVALLKDDGGDEFLMLVRIAAAMVVHEDKRREAEAEKAAMRRGG